MMSDAGVALVKLNEGLRLTRYLDSAGHWTIGWGHLIDDYDEIPSTIPEAVAESLLSRDLLEAERLMDSLVAVPLAQNQRDALIDFVFNLGYSRLRRSTLLRRLNAGDYGVADPLPSKLYPQPDGGTFVLELPFGEFSKWVWEEKSPGVNEVNVGLQARRAREGRLWITGDWQEHDDGA